MNDLPRVHIEGPLAPYRDGLWARLRERGYTGLSARNLLRVAAHLSRWIQGQGLRPGHFDEAYIEDYLRQRREAGYVNWLSPRGLEPILEYLRGVGVVPPARGAPIGSTPLDGLLSRYVRYLEEERGLSASVVLTYERLARSFLRTCVGAELHDLARLSAADIVEHVQRETCSCSVGYARIKLSALRSLLRFLHLAGDLPGDLTGRCLP